MFQVVKMVTNPKTYLACSLKGLYRKAASIRKKIRIHSIIVPIKVVVMIDKINKYTHSIRHHHHQSSWRKFRNVTIITFTLLAIVSSGALVFNQARHRILVF